MTRRSELTEEQGVVLAAVNDRKARGDSPGTTEEISADTAWPGERTYGMARTSRILRELQELGYVRRVRNRARGVYWVTRGAKR
jgi:hypothetical protein